MGIHYLHPIKTVRIYYYLTLYIVRASQDLWHMLFNFLMPKAPIMYFLIIIYVIDAFRLRSKKKSVCSIIDIKHIPVDIFLQIPS